MLKLLLPLIGWGYIRFVAATSRIIPHGEEIVSRLKREGKVFIYTFWHGRQILLPYVRRMDTIDALISQSKDGEYIARTIRFFGMDSVRGSTSKGSRRALAQLTRSLKGGRLIALTPDGPMGPKHKVKPGVIYIAKKMGVPIVPLSFGAKRKKIFYGWDEFHAPRRS